MWPTGFKVYKTFSAQGLSAQKLFVFNTHWLVHFSDRSWRMSNKCITVGSKPVIKKSLPGGFLLLCCFRTGEIIQEWKIIFINVLVNLTYGDRRLCYGVLLSRNFSYVWFCQKIFTAFLLVRSFWNVRHGSWLTGIYWSSKRFTGISDHSGQFMIL